LAPQKAPSADWGHRLVLCFSSNQTNRFPHDCDQPKRKIEVDQALQWGRKTVPRWQSCFRLSMCPLQCPIGGGTGSQHQVRVNQLSVPFLPNPQVVRRRSSLKKGVAKAQESHSLGYLSISRLISFDCQLNDKTSPPRYVKTWDNSVANSQHPRSKQMTSACRGQSARERARS
jgi:hypothetical protein